MTKDRGENKPDIYGKPEYGDWANSSEYKQFDRVNYKGAIYAARKANSGVNPFFDDGDTWELIDGVAFEANDTMEVETVNGTLVSGRKVNASGGIGSNVTSKGINIYGMKASKNSYGVVKIGDGINIDDGVISADSADPYTLPTATGSVLGGVKIGSGINVTDDGTISVSGGSGSEWTKIDTKVNNSSGIYVKCIAFTNGKKVICAMKDTTSYHSTYNSSATIDNLPVPKICNEIDSNLILSRYYLNEKINIEIWFNYNTKKIIFSKSLTNSITATFGYLYIEYEI